MVGGGESPNFQVESGVPDETFQLNLEILQWSTTALRLHTDNITLEYRCSTNHKLTLHQSLV